MSSIPLVEIQPFEYKILEKEKKDGVLMTLEGVFQRADTLNANRRVYPRTLWQKLMKDEDLSSRIDSRRMVGELDHPANGATSISRVSHVVTEHELKTNGEVRGKIEVLDTPAGKIANTLFRAGVQLGVSSRGDGTVEKKGDTSEVQEDFKLETYDLVLKPSTPGAYPQIIESEEEAQRNVELIANAVEGLVNTTSDLDVLLECHKIISVLGGCESRCESILKSLKSRISETQGTSSEEPPIVEEPSNKETPMKTDPNQSPELSPEIAAFLKEQIDRGIAEAVAEKDAKISELNEMLVGLTQTKEDLALKLATAEESVETSQEQIKSLEENASSDEELQERYDAACAIIDEAIPRLQELGDKSRRLEAAESLLSVSIDRHKEEAVERTIDHHLDGVDEELAKKLRPFLSECESGEEVEQVLESLQGLIESFSPEQPQVREPLPTRGSTRVTESQEPEQVVEHSDFITRRLLGKIAGVAQ